MPIALREANRTDLSVFDSRFRGPGCPVSVMEFIF